MKARWLYAALAALVVIAVATTGATAGDNPKATKKVVTVDCINAVTGQDEGDITYDGPDSVWPPNHKYVTATITLTDDDAEPATDGAAVAVAGTHDQILSDGTELNGSGNTDPATDVVPGAGSGSPSASAPVSFRAERSGREQDGRVYTFTVTGTTDSTLSECEPVTFTATVPHDQGAGAGKPASKKLSVRKLRARRAR